MISLLVPELLPSGLFDFYCISFLIEIIFFPDWDRIRYYSIISAGRPSRQSFGFLLILAGTFGGRLVSHYFFKMINLQKLRASRLVSRRLRTVKASVQAGEKNFPPSNRPMRCAFKSCKKRGGDVRLQGRNGERRVISPCPAVCLSVSVAMATPGVPPRNPVPKLKLQRPAPPPPPQRLLIPGPARGALPAIIAGYKCSMTCKLETCLFDHIFSLDPPNLP